MLLYTVVVKMFLLHIFRFMLIFQLSFNALTIIVCKHVQLTKQVTKPFIMRVYKKVGKKEKVIVLEI